MKKVFEYIGLLSLMCFSFFLTDKTVNVVKDVDEIMVAIKENKDSYLETGIDATIILDTIIPGMVSREVNVDKSYQAMRKIGVYDPNFLIYDTKKPKVSVDDNLDKYITKGNPQKRMVSLIFLVEEGQLEDVLNVIGDTKVSFVVPNYLFQHEINNIETGKKAGHEFLVSEEKSSEYKSFMQKMTTMGIHVKYCYNPNKNAEFAKLCEKNIQYSIRPHILISDRPLQTVKEKLEAGAIIVLKTNSNLLKELPNILDYINSKGYEIESLGTHLQEN